MIKSTEHAQAVQARRYKAGKKGIAKAIRRFLHSQSVYDEVPTLQINWAGCDPNRNAAIEQEVEKAQQHLRATIKSDPLKDRTFQLLGI